MDGKPIDELHAAIRELSREELELYAYGAGIAVANLVYSVAEQLKPTALAIAFRPAPGMTEEARRKCSAVSEKVYNRTRQIKLESN